jgi:hypothetical protein
MVQYLNKILVSAPSPPVISHPYSRRHHDSRQLNADNIPWMKNLALGMSSGLCFALAVVPPCLTAGPDNLAGVSRLSLGCHVPRCSTTSQ